MSAVYAAEGADFRGPLDVTKAATAVLDADGTVVGWGPAAHALLGYPPHEAVGRPIGTLVVDRPGEYHLSTPLPGAAQARRQVLHMRHRDGHILRVTAATLPLSHAGTGPAKLLAVADADETERWEALQSMLRGLATQSPVGLAIYDTDLRVVWTNHALYREMGTFQYAGLGPDEMVSDGEILSDGYPATLEEAMRRVVDTGEPVIELHYSGRPPNDPEHDHVWSCSYYRLQDADGRALGVCEETVDITARYLAQQRLDLLVRAGGRVGTSLDMTRTAQELSAVAVPQFADGITVDLIDVVLEGDQPVPGTAAARRVVRVWEGPVTGDGDAHPARRRPVDHPADSLQARCLAVGRPVLDTGEGSVHSRLAVPLRTEGAALGVVTFRRDRHPDPFESGDLMVADELVARAAVSIDNARRFTREHAAALTLQRSLLPRHLPRLTGVDVAHRYLPADSRAGVGGDWYDVIALSGTRVGLVVGDVVGHGMRAAATMGRLRTSVRAFARLDLPPDELLTRLDELVTQDAHEQSAVHTAAGTGTQTGAGEGDDPALGVTCLYAVYDPVAGRCSMARAGSPLPSVVDPATGAVSHPDVPAGPPLGLGGLPFESAEFDLPEGSLMALFTDGLVQGRDRDRDAELAALHTVLADHRTPLDDLCDRIVATLLPGPVEDDAALLLVRTRTLDSHEVAAWDLADDPEAVGRARALATGQVDAWGLDGELSFTTELVVSELVTNAIRYASGPIQLRLIRDRTLICEVSDSGHTSPHLRRAGSDDEGGRGLFLIAQMTQQWGTRYTPTGKTIWAEQPIPP
ncbi:PAS domain S-box protein [Streptomyces sp. WAC05374]|uniref:SpoIIE family protein phosphatase n=1 Tax=Streptomyces sp. WAC05374 TaxID=2487420 RepID=UPI000F8943BC|nr:SpoIIE family protein phosphatase [Streptomyces sp. WAC05374]RST19191.1 PAS domain S-box protein [Streptomyces sp. WAC05374]TDF50479.1 PAS domain S-box protein [Streptomyces sp. WAC05374]TDF51847.1 PAS domain S-box protein [Streptomyces sp. WAC05374]TDF60733.1 PAS domain S-box protein [Streptomyces sp. WAC05374]